MEAYLQTADGLEEELTVQSPDPKDGTLVIPLFGENIVWIRLVPTEEDYWRKMPRDRKP